MSSRDGLEVERLLSIQLKAGHYCLGGSNPTWGMVPAIIIMINNLHGPAA